MADARDILEGLSDIRLPAASEGGAFADAAAAFALGLALAFLAVLAARLFLARPPSRRAAALAALERSRDLAPGERLLAQARLLQHLDAEPPPPIAAALRDGLYRPAPEVDPGAVDPEAIDRALLRLIARTRG